jgi:hypothetical protein
LVTWAQAASAAHSLAQSITRTAFVPEAFRGKPDDAAVAILMGAEVGLSPLQALASLFVVRGRPGMYARAQVALVQSRGHQVWTEESGPESVTVCGQRAGSEHVERVTWTMERARLAGLTRQNAAPWRDHPEAMLYARASTDVARRIAADVLLGIPEETEAEAPAGDSGAAQPVQRRRPAASPLPAPPDYVAPAESVRIEHTEPNRTLSPDEPETEPDDDDDEPDEDVEPAITDAQRARLHAEFRGAGMDRDTYLAWSSRVLEVDPPLDTLAGITVTQASALLDRIAAIRETRRRNTEPDASAAPGSTISDEDMREDRADAYRTTD